MSNLQKALHQQKKKNEQVKLKIYGTIISINRSINVPNRAGFVYVKLRDNQNEIIEALNNKVAQSEGVPVILHREGNRYIIQGVNTERYQNNWNSNSPLLPIHGTSHSFIDGGGGDVAWIFSKQFMPLLGYPNSVTGSSLLFAPYPLLGTTGWKSVGNTGTPSVLPYLPTGSDSLMLLAYLDSTTGNPGFLVGSGSHFPSLLTGAIDVYRYIPVPSSTQIPVTAVRLTSGTRTVTWNNIYDVRQWLHASASGTSSGGGGGVSGITGLPVYHDGEFIATGTSLRVDGNVSVTSSGSSIILNFPYPYIHTHALARWVADGSGTYNYPMVVDTIMNVTINGLEEDALLYSLSTDKTQLIFSSNVTAGYVIQSSYIPEIV